MLMPNQLTNVSWLGRKESKPQFGSAAEEDATTAFSFSPQSPAPVLGGSFCKAEVLICLLLYHSQSASELLMLCALIDKTD